MRNRSIKKQVWLNSKENELLKNKCRKAGISESAFFRLIIENTEIKEKPDENFYKILNDLRGIAVNINQLARVANSYKIVRLQELFGDNYTKEKILDRIENKNHNKIYIPQKKYKMTIEEYNKFKQKQREYQLGKLPLLYILICLLLKIDPIPQRVELNNYKIPITREMKIAIKHLDSLSEQTILLTENKINNLNNLKSYRYNQEEKLRILKGKRESLWRKRSKETNPEIKDKITHEIDDLNGLIKKVNKVIVNCFEIENRTILLQNQLKIERTKEKIKEKKKDKLKIR